MFLMFILALLPIIWLIVALTALKLEAWSASLSALVITALEAVFIWSMPVFNMITAATEGFAMALWPITIVIIAAVFTYNLTVHTHAMDTIKAMLTSVSADKRVLTLLIGWCFGCFLEGMAGFGTAIAIPASMLVALGMNPITSILVCLLANGVPTMFGSIGIPTNTMASLTGLSITELSATQVIGVAPFVIAVPFLMVMLVGGGPKALKGMVGLCLISGISFLIPEFFTAAFVGADLAVVVGAVVSLALTFAYALRHKNRPVAEEDRLQIEDHGKISAGEALRAWSPFILIFVVLLLTSSLVPFINKPLNSIASTINFYAGDPEATLTFKWVNTPGVLIFICAIIGGLIQRCSFHDMGVVLGQTCKQMSKTVVTMLGVLGLAKIMGYAGMITDIANFFVSTLGSYYPLVAPLLGALGTFVTGSGTSSSVLFGNVQLQAAQAIGANEYWLVGANAVGVSAGKMLSPQSIAIGTAACDCSGKESEIFSKILPYFIVFVVLMAIITLAGSFVIPA